MNILMGKPAKAGPDQNHPAHIQSHQAVMGSPGGAAHISEHLAWQMRTQIQQMIGHPLPPPGQPLPPQIENQVAMMVAQAFQQLQAQAAAQAPGGAQDPQAGIAEKALQTEVAAIAQKAEAAQIDQETKLAVANIQSQDKAAANATKLRIANTRATAMEESHDITNPNIPPQ